MLRTASRIALLHREIQGALQECARMPIKGHLWVVVVPDAGGCEKRENTQGPPRLCASGARAQGDLEKQAMPVPMPMPGLRSGKARAGPHLSGEPQTGT